jgi:hypothetical protein
LQNGLFSQWSHRCQQHAHYVRTLVIFAYVNLLSLCQTGDEVIPLSEPVELLGVIEDWLNQIMDVMHSCLRNEMARAMTEAEWWFIDGTNARSHWALRLPAQVVLAAAAIHWTGQVESALEEGLAGKKASLPECLLLCEAQQSELIVVLRQPSLSKGDRMKLMCLVTLDTHRQEVVRRLIDSQVFD